MRTWLVVLLLLGVGTAGTLRFWPRASEGAQAGSGPVALVDEAPVAVVDDEPAGVVPDGVANASTVSVPDATTAPTAVTAEEQDRPGGATSAPEGEAAKKAIALLDQASKSANPVEQARLLSDAIRGGALDKKADEKAYADLQEANKRGLFNPRVTDLCYTVEVKKGDSLWEICKQARKDGHSGVTPGLVRLVNGMVRDSIYPGAKLKIPNVPVTVLVEKRSFRLSVFVGDVMIKRYLVGLGKDNKTPEGEFKIKTKLIDPPWYKQGEKAPLPSEHPENILGTRWLGFAEKEGFPDAATFGIHGTKEDQSIGTESSNGCVRMHNPEVEELYEWVGEGVIVTIRA